MASSPHLSARLDSTRHIAANTLPWKHYVYMLQSPTQAISISSSRYPTLKHHQLETPRPIMDKTKLRYVFKETDGPCRTCRPSVVSSYV